MKRIFLIAILVWQLAPGVFAAQTAPADPSAPLDLPGYTAELDRWSSAAQRLRAHPEEAAVLRKQLPDHWSVAVQEQRFQVSTAWLGAGLDGVAAHPQQAARTSTEMGDRLAAMLRDARDLAVISEPGSNPARAKLDDILKRSEFRSVHARSPGESFWDQLTDWAWKFLFNLFNRVGGHPTAAKVLLWGVVIAMGVAFLGWLIFSIARLSRSDFSTRRSRAPAEGTALAGTWREWVVQARAAAARGDFRDAIRIIYGAAVRRIEEAGTWQFDPSRTHREYVRLLPADSLQRPALVAITTCYERVWFGRALASAADFETALAELESLP
jgi:hypothetical protein